VAVYVLAVRHDHFAKAPPSEPITPVTIVTAGAVFVIILIASTGRPGARLASAVVAAIAGPMIFELPFDLIVMARTYPPIAPDPALYRLVFFAPLFFVEITTLLLLSTSARVRLTRPALLSLALILVVFTAWALDGDGFAYPAAPFPIAMNVLSKLLAFAVVLGLFGRSGRRCLPVLAGPDGQHGRGRLTAFGEPLGREPDLVPDALVGPQRLGPVAVQVAGGITTVSGSPRSTNPPQKHGCAPMCTKPPARRQHPSRLGQTAG
jgi:hypothetical protein